MGLVPLPPPNCRRGLAQKIYFLATNLTGAFRSSKGRREAITAAAAACEGVSMPMSLLWKSTVLSTHELENQVHILYMLHFKFIHMQHTL